MLSLKPHEELTGLVARVCFCLWFSAPVSCTKHLFLWVPRSSSHLSSQCSLYCYLLPSWPTWKPHRRTGHPSEYLSSWKHLCHSACRLHPPIWQVFTFLLHSFDLTFNSRPLRHKEGNVLDLISARYLSCGHSCWPTPPFRSSLVSCTTPNPPCSAWHQLFIYFPYLPQSPLELFFLSGFQHSSSHSLPGVLFLFSSSLQCLHLSLSVNICLQGHRGGSMLAPCRPSTGGPQGSVLGYLLFSFLSSCGFSYHCYADDISNSSSPFLPQTVTFLIKSQHVWQTSQHRRQLTSWK